MKWRVPWNEEWMNENMKLHKEGENENCRVLVDEIEETGKRENAQKPGHCPS